MLGTVSCFSSISTVKLGDSVT